MRGTYCSSSEYRWCKCDYWWFRFKGQVVHLLKGLSTLHLLSASQSTLLNSGSPFYWLPFSTYNDYNPVVTVSRSKVIRRQTTPVPVSLRSKFEDDVLCSYDRPWCFSFWRPSWLCSFISTEEELDT